MIIDDEQLNAMFCIIRQHIEQYYPNDMLIVENYHNINENTNFDLFRAHITKGDWYTRVENRRKILECSGSAIFLRSIRNKKILLNQLRLLGLEVYW